MSVPCANLASKPACKVAIGSEPSASRVLRNAGANAAATASTKGRLVNTGNSEANVRMALVPKVAPFAATDSTCTCPGLICTRAVAR